MIGNRMSMAAALGGMSLVAALVAASLVVASDARSAERECVGAIGPETVAGDLFVPPGEVCELAGTTVLGNTRVGEQAQLFAEEADLRGNVAVATEGFVELFESTVAGTIKLTDSVGVFSDDSSIGNIDSSGSDFVSLFGGTIAGNVKARGGSTIVFADRVTVGGNLEGTGLDLFDLSGSTVNGNFYVRDNESGSIFCGNTMNGSSEFTNNSGLLTIGTPDEACRGNRLNGNVLVARNTADTEISNNTVAGNLTCRGNAPPPVGGGNQVAGNKEGQCRAL
jgi:hypothetical protein